MKRFYQMFLALALIMLGATTASGQKIYRAELDKSMFKAWDSNLPGAKEDTNPAAEPKENQPFKCTYDLYKEVGAYGTVYGSGNVYYLWYADLTGTQKMYVTGTPGMSIRLMFNRQAPTEGVGDADGGSYVEIVDNIPDNGTLVFDLAADTRLSEYIHLNAIKVPGGGKAGVVTAIEIEGTVRPVTGILSMINNGDAENDDVTSFPVSYDGPNNGETANDKPEIVEGAGVDGSRCFKVTSFPNPTQTWHTQLYIKADEVMPRGTKWKLVMSIKADHASNITTSAQGLPRQWKGGFIEQFRVSDEWKEFTWTGEIGVDDFQSIAFDLNNGDDGAAGNGGCAFYFDNIQFGTDLGGANPMSNVGLGYAINVIRVDFANNTNMKELVEAKGITITVPDEKGENMVKTKSLIFDNSSTTITWNGKACNILSVEGRTDGNLYIFLKDMDGQGGEEYGDDAEVKIAFKNPADNDHHLTFKEGKWAGEAVPDFDGLVCPYDASMTEKTYYSYLYAAPELLSAEPENGSFNLSADLKDFVVTFTQPVDVTTVNATLSGEALTVAPTEGYTEVVTLTRTGDTPLAGVKQLIIATGVANAQETATTEDITLKYSFGESQTSEEVKVIYQAVFKDDGSADALGAGWIVNADAGGMQPANSGSGCRLMHNQGAFLDDLLYIAQRGTPNVPGGIALYGTEADHNLTLEGGKSYKLTLGACQHDKTGVALLAQVLSAENVDATNGSVIEGAKSLVEERKEITPAKSSKEAIRFDLDFTAPADGNYVLRFVSTKADGSAGGYDGCVVFGDVKVEYIPDVMGLLEMKALAAALENAKTTLDQNGDERYAGVAYTTLAELIKEYDGKVMTSPSAYTEGTNKLNAAATALSDHRKACDTYDGLAQQTLQIVDNNAEKKFAALEAYASLKNLVAKYEVTKEEEIQGEGEEQKTVTVYKFKVLTDDDELAAANKELQGAIDLANLLFTEGVSTPENSNGGKGTGIAVFVDRLRLGAEDLKALGVAADDELVVKANNALTDDDDLAQYLMTRTTQEVYGKLKDADDKFFQTITVDDETLEETVEPKEYDMTVFVKNPNIYKQQPNMNYTTENVPGWTTPEGFGKPGLSVGWGAPKNIEGVAEDCMFQTWGAAYRAEQTITNLPVGIYTVKFGFGERNDDASNEFNLAYVKTSKIKEGEQFTDSIQPKVIGQAFPFAGATNAAIIDSVEVKDGLLTIGVNAGNGSHTFFNEVRLVLVGAVKDFDYGKAYADGIETIENKEAVRVRAIELYDLNGRRVTKATKGLVIMKKVMNDGTVRTQKVVK